MLSCLGALNICSFILFKSIRGRGLFQISMACVHMLHMYVSKAMRSNLQAYIASKTLENQHCYHFKKNNPSTFHLISLKSVDFLRTVQDKNLPLTAPNFRLTPPDIYCLL